MSRYVSPRCRRCSINSPYGSKRERPNFCSPCSKCAEIYLPWCTGQNPDRNRTRVGQTTGRRSRRALLPEPKPPGLGMVSCLKTTLSKESENIRQLKTPLKSPHRAHSLHNSPSTLRTTISLMNRAAWAEKRSERTLARSETTRWAAIADSSGSSPAAIDDHIMTGEGHPHLFAVTLRVNKLMPGKHHGLLLKHDLQRCGRIAGADDPWGVTGRDHVHVGAPFSRGAVRALAEQPAWKLR